MDLAEKCAYYQSFLNLDDLNIQLQQKTQFFEATLNFDQKTNSWIIEYNDDLTEAYLVHELGHLVLMKQLNFPDIAKPMIKDPQVNMNLQPIINAVVDLFVNCNLARFPKIYEILKQQLCDYVDEMAISRNHIHQETDLPTLLSWYILWVVLFQYFLTKKDFTTKKLDFKELIAELEFKLRNMTKRLMPKQLIRIKKDLNTFPNFLNPITKRGIYIFTKVILKSIKLWTIKEINYALHWYFPNYK